MIDTPTNNQVIFSGDSINIKGWAVNKSGIKDVQVSMDGNFLVGAQYYISRPDINLLCLVTQAVLIQDL